MSVQQEHDPSDHPTPGIDSSTYDGFQSLDENGYYVEAHVLNRDHQPQVLERDIESERPQLGSRQRKNEFEPYMNGDITNISQYTETFMERFPDASKEKSEQTVNYPDLAARPFNDKPIAPEWFDLESINDLERLTLPDLFDDGTMTETYTQYRNYMVTTYRSHPDYYLTATTCKSAFPDADLVSLVRIHGMLEFYGIINTHVDPRRRIYDPLIESEPDAGVKPSSQRDFDETPRGTMDYLRKLIFDPSSALQSNQWDLSIQDPFNVDARTTYICSSCRTDCSAARYQCVKYGDTHVCADCFVDGRFSSALSSGDFIHVEAPERLSFDDDWSSVEIIRLLEAIDLYDDDWLLVSEHVGSRSKEQCITQFLQMPIEDELLTARITEEEQGELPFNDTSNPVMTLVAFLAGHVNPGVAAAAAKAAIQVLAQADASKGDTPKADAPAADEDSMQLDIPSGAFTEETMAEATQAALKSAAEQAEKLASYEDEEIQHWTRLATKTLIDKLMAKVQQFDQLDSSFENELKEIEKQHSVLISSADTLRKQYAALASYSSPSTPTSHTPMSMTTQSADTC